NYLIDIETQRKATRYTISPLGKAVLITGCESPLARALAKYLDDLGFTVFAGFKKLQDSDDAIALKETSSGRLKLLQLNVTSEVEVSGWPGPRYGTVFLYYALCAVAVRLI
uniref:Uncharacterized protein n=1 Tax=Anopheles maculatus TaxID=74869 RepID=A0A182SLD2_9DIPT